MKHNNNTPRSRYTISFSDRDVWYVDNIEDELVQSKLSSDSSHIIRRTFPVSLKDLENKVLKDIKEDDERVKRENESRRLRNIPVITGDSDTDELLEDERLAQEEVAKELKERADKKAEEYLKEEEHFIKIEEENKEIERLRKIDNNIIDAIEDRAVDQQINMMRGK